MNLPYQVDTVTVGEAHVGKTKLKIPVRQGCPGVGKIGGAYGVDIHAQQCQLQEFPDVRFVIDDQGCGVTHVLQSLSLSWKLELEAVASRRYRNIADTDVVCIA